jgi:hypothetical protein
VVLVQHGILQHTRLDIRVAQSQQSIEVQQMGPELGWSKVLAIATRGNIFVIFQVILMINF